MTFGGTPGTTDAIPSDVLGELSAQALAQPSDLVHPRVLALLRERGSPGPETGNRDGGVATALMALFRDRRGAEEFQALYDLTSPDLLQWIVGQLRGRRQFHDPLELLQDTFVNVYRYAGGFRDERPSSFRVWSRRIATNVVRRASIRRRGAGHVQLPDRAAEPIDPRRGPGESVVAAEQSRSLRSAWLLLLVHYAAAVEQLGDRDRRALDLVEIHGLSYLDAASQLGVGSSNMKMILFRARKRIREAVSRAFAAASEETLRVAG